MLAPSLGVVYTCCFALCAWPQIIKSLRTKTVDDISISSSFLAIIGYITAIGYTGLTVGFNFWLLTNYILSLISAIVMVVVYYKFRK